LGVSALLCALLPQASAAQDRRHPRWEIPGFDFRKDGVWRVRARAVRATRARLRAAGRFGELNASAAVAGGAAPLRQAGAEASATVVSGTRSEEHTSELQSRFDLVCRLLLEKKN